MEKIHQSIPQYIYIIPNHEGLYVCIYVLYIHVHPLAIFTDFLVYSRKA